MKKLLLVARSWSAPRWSLAQAGSDAQRERSPSRRSRPSRLEGPDASRSARRRPAPTPAVSIRPTILKPLADEWTSYSGDLSGKRYSALKLVNTTTVKNLSLKWMNHAARPAAARTGTRAGGGRRRRRGGGGGGGGGGGRGGGGGGGSITPIIVGGLGNGDANNCGNRAPGGGILFVDGIIYAGSPFNVYAIDARDGTMLWHYYWKTRGGTALQTRGVGMWHNYVYFTMHDDWVVCLDAKTGKEVWRHEIAPHDQQYFSSNAPMVRRRSHPRRHRQRPRRAGVPEVARSAHRRGAVDPLLDAAEPGRAGPRDLGEPRRRAPRQRRDVDSRRPTIRRRSSTSTARAIRRRPTRRAAAKATTCSRRACSR